MTVVDTTCGKHACVEHSSCRWITIRCTCNECCALAATLPPDVERLTVDGWTLCYKPDVRFRVDEMIEFLPATNPL